MVWWRIWPQCWSVAAHSFQVPTTPLVWPQLCKLIKKSPGEPSFLARGESSNYVNPAPTLPPHYRKPPKPASLLCSPKPFLNLLAPSSPQKASLCELGTLSGLLVVRGPSSVSISKPDFGEGVHLISVRWSPRSVQHPPFYRRGNGGPERWSCLREAIKPDNSFPLTSLLFLSFRSHEFYLLKVRE